MVPYFAPQYYKARPGIGIPEKDVLKLDSGSGIGLHPQMGAMKELHDDGIECFPLPVLPEDSN